MYLNHIKKCMSYAMLISMPVNCLNPGMIKNIAQTERYSRCETILRILEGDHSLRPSKVNYGPYKIMLDDYNKINNQA